MSSSESSFTVDTSDMVEMSLCCDGFSICIALLILALTSFLHETLAGKSRWYASTNQYFRRRLTGELSGLSIGIYAFHSSWLSGSREGQGTKILIGMRTLSRALGDIIGTVNLPVLSRVELGVSSEGLPLLSLTSSILGIH